MAGANGLGRGHPERGLVNRRRGQRGTRRRSGNRNRARGGGRLAERAEFSTGWVREPVRVGAGGVGVTRERAADAAVCKRKDGAEAPGRRSGLAAGAAAVERASAPVDGGTKGTEDRAADAIVAARKLERRGRCAAEAAATGANGVAGRNE
jgi:hypothetical protein